MGPKSITKGKAFERKVAVALRQVYPDARRGLAQARDGAETPDITGTGFWIEVKCGQRINIPTALEQATKATDGRPVLVISKLDRKPVTVTMYLFDFIQLIAITQNPEVKS